MEIEIIRVGELYTNCYILIKDNNAIIIDPGDDKDKIINYLEKNRLSLKAILITHCHFDHIGALNDILKYKNVDVYNNSNLEEKNYNLFGFNFDVIKTYGHTNDSITFYFKENSIMFCGDFIFKGSVGRTDLPTGDYIMLLKSIKLIKSYPDNTIIYPGHGDKTLLGIEKKTNIYF